MTDIDNPDPGDERKGTPPARVREPESRATPFRPRAFTSWPQVQAVAGRIRPYKDLLWWLHSGYALLLGVGVMWVGTKRFGFLKVVIFYIAFVWLAALFLPVVARHTELSPAWRNGIRTIINYFSKNFYQQLLFFLLPLYYSSSTFLSANFFFVLILAASAVLSTLDVFYDRYISAKWSLATLFLAFNLFACINVMLPVLWRISNSAALWISTGLTLLCLVTLVSRVTGWRGPRFFFATGSAALLLLIIVVFLRFLIPPAPLRLAGVTFGKSVRALEVVSPFEQVPPNWSRPIVALTAIKAPNGLTGKVHHLWYVDGRLVYSQAPREIIGGREKGYRIWSQITWGKNIKGRKITLDVETDGGQLIGRAYLPVAR